MTHTLRHIFQILRGQAGIRVMILLLMAVVVKDALDSGTGLAVNVAMFRPTAAGAESLVANLHALAAMTLAIAFTLGQPGSYLLDDDWMVYIRRRRGIDHFLRYLLLTGAYSMLAVGLIGLAQGCAVASRLPVGGAGRLASTSLCAALTLWTLLLVIDLGHLLGNQTIGYLAATLAYVAVLLAHPLQEALLDATVAAPLPNWAITLPSALGLLAVADGALFLRAEIL